MDEPMIAGMKALASRKCEFGVRHEADQSLF